MAFLKALVLKTFITNKGIEYPKNKNKSNSQQATMTIHGVTFIDFDNNGKLSRNDKYEFNGKTDYIPFF